MKIYVITKGDYSDYHICGVATDPEKAERLAKIHTDRWDDAQVEEYDTDRGEDLLEGRFPFAVCFFDWRDPRVDDEKENDSFEPGIEALDQLQEENVDFLRPIYYGPKMTVRLYAPDEQTALKIAQDKRAQYLAEKAGI